MSFWMCFSWFLQDDDKSDVVKNIPRLLILWIDEDDSFHSFIHCFFHRCGEKKRIFFTCKSTLIESTADVLSGMKENWLLIYLFRLGSVVIIALGSVSRGFFRGGHGQKAAVFLFTVTPESELGLLLGGWLCVCTGTPPTVCVCVHMRLTNRHEIDTEKIGWSG